MCRLVLLLLGLCGGATVGLFFSSSLFVLFVALYFGYAAVF